jgi:signal transduction histidine kinase
MTRHRGEKCLEDHLESCWRALTSVELPPVRVKTSTAEAEGDLFDHLADLPLIEQSLVEVSVNDTGVGIAPEDQEAVFEEFRQVGTTEKKAEGTGLGLTLCRKFVELHGGRIWVKSQVGVGSTFMFTIPVLRGE